MDEIVSAVSSVGFPIIAYILMYKMANETIKENTKALSELKEALIKNKECI